MTEDEYNEAICAKCQELSIQVVGLVDHGAVSSVEGLRAALQASGVLVFPGFEVASTEKVHMVCLFSEDADQSELSRYLGCLGLSNVKDRVRSSNLGCIDLARRVEELNGFWYAAHITGNNGLLRLGIRDGGSLNQIWRHPNAVRILQIPGSIEELTESEKKILLNQNPDYRRDRPMIVINASDVSDPEDLAKPGSSCWVKMTRPSFDAFKVAFLDAESRVHLCLAEQRHSALVSLGVQGGYLDGLEAHFSKHLNTVIGGRGTGKSTLIEFIRYVLEIAPIGRQAERIHQDILRENLGRASGVIVLKVLSTALNGAEYTLTRRYGEPLTVRDSTGAISLQRPRDLLPGLEIYGQNEILELIQDNSNRLRILERFLPSDFGALVERREALRKRLVDNAAKLLKSFDERDEITEQLAGLPRLTEQLTGLRNLGIEARLARLPLYAREKQLVERVDEEMARVEAVCGALVEIAPESAYLSERSLESLPDAQELRALRTSLEGLREDLVRQQQSFQATLDRRRAELVDRRNTWLAALSAGEQELEVALAALPDLAGKSGREVGTAYKWLTQEIERIQPQRTREGVLAQLIEALLEERTALIQELSEVRRQRQSQLQGVIQRLNERLSGQLRIGFEAEGDRQSLVDFLVACKLDRLGVGKFAWIQAESATPLELAQLIRRGADSLAERYGVTGFVAGALSQLPVARQFELEALELGDEVFIELNVAHGSREEYRDLSRLSTGQQCTAILHLLLLENTDPLIIDQPEDNLDNSFIAERIVRALRESKTSRQFLFSTHNANIPVFGDAEWIGVLSAADGRGAMPLSHQGSIDVPGICKSAAEILEGGPHAFNQRREMYGF